MSHRTVIPLVLALLGTSAAWAEATSGHSLTLAQAVDQAVRHAREVEIARQDVARSQGALQTTSGAFDRTLVFESEFSEERIELFGARLKNEEERRLLLEVSSKALDLAANALEAGLPDAGTLLRDDCQAPLRQVAIISPDGTQILLCFNTSGDFDGLVLTSPPPGTPPGFLLSGSNLSELLRVLQIAPEQISQDYLNFFTDLLRRLVSTLRQTAENLRIKRARLGDMPSEEQFLKLDINLSHQWRFRNGVGLSASLTLQGTEDNFTGKPHDPDFGDATVPNTFVSTVGMRLDVPLAKGRGVDSTGAAEKSAKLNLEASEALLNHTSSQTALQTVLAYWRLAAAEARLEPLADAVATQEKLLEQTRELVAADQVVKAELNRLSARLAELKSQHAAGKVDVIDARLALAQTIGWQASTLEQAPIAGEDLPQPVPAAEIASSGRHDVKAAGLLAASSSVLEKAATRDLRPQVDFVVQVSFNGLYESFDDRLFDLGGYWKALEEDVAGPSYALGLRYKWPFGNNRARGRLLQAQAARARAEIQQTDLERRIKINLASLLGELERTQAELRERDLAIAALKSSLESSLELFKAGELTLIDTLTTEQQLTDARVARIDLVRRIAELEARRRFEAGALLDQKGALVAFNIPTSGSWSLQAAP